MQLLLLVLVLWENTRDGLYILITYITMDGYVYPKYKLMHDQNVSKLVTYPFKKKISKGQTTM